MAHVFNPDKHGVNVGQEFQQGLISTFDNEYPYAYMQRQLDYLWSVGIRRLRWASANYSWRNDDPEVSGGISNNAAHKALIPLALAMGFHVEWGIGMINPSKPEYWEIFKPIAIEEALWFQDQVATYASAGATGKWIIGNESIAFGAYTSSNIVSASRTSNVVTIDCGFDHGYDVGHRVIISGNSFYTVNGGTVASVPSSSTFTINSSGSDGSANGGTVTDWTPIQLRKRYKKLAADLEAAGLTMTQVYSMLQGWESTNFFTYAEWQTSSPSNYDSFDNLELQLNIYGIDGVSQYYGSGAPALSRTFAWFKENVRRYYVRPGYTFPFVISEIGLYHNDDNNSVTKSVDPYVPRSPMQRFKWWKKRLDHLATLDMDIYMFAMKMSSGQNHLSMGRPMYSDEDIAYQEIWDYYLSRPTTGHVVSPITL